MLEINLKPSPVFSAVPQELGLSLHPPPTFLGVTLWLHTSLVIPPLYFALVLCPWGVFSRMIFFRKKGMQAL